MKLYLVRHGESVVEGVDDLRPLSDMGKQQILWLAKRIAHLHLPVAQLFHSKKLRAIQTAELLMPAMSFNGPAAALPNLDPQASVTDFAQSMDDWQGDTLLVGHLPFMDKLVSKLLTGDENHPIVTFKPGSMVALERFAKDRWIITWMLIPALLSP